MLPPWASFEDCDMRKVDFLGCWRDRDTAGLTELTVPSGDRCLREGVHSRESDGIREGGEESKGGGKRLCGPVLIAEFERN